MTATVSKQQLATGFSAVVAVAVRELKQVPSGHLYARVMEHLDLPSYEKIIDILKSAGLVAEDNFMLKWIAPAKEVV